MLIRSLFSILVVASSFLLVNGQTPNPGNAAADNAAKRSGAGGTEKSQDMPFPNGINLKFLIKELASDMGTNVLFDRASNLDNRTVKIELRDVTTPAALNYILLQEGLVSEEVGPKTILITDRSRAASVPRLGVGVAPLTDQLAQYFRVKGGLLINDVRPNSAAAKAGLTAGDVIVAIDGEPVRGTVGLINAIDARKDGDVSLTIVRNRKERTLKLNL